MLHSATFRSYGSRRTIGPERLVMESIAPGFTERVIDACQQTFRQRPHEQCSTGRTPIPGVYIGGGGVHPGIPGSLAGGYHAAGVVCEDLGLTRWWPTPKVIERARESRALPESLLPPKRAKSPQVRRM